MTMEKRSNLRPTNPPTRRDVLKQAVSLGAGLAATHLLGREAAARARCELGSFTTEDGVTLRYLEAGRGRPLVLIPGWSQTAAMFASQIEAFARYHRVIALDMRGHGDSDKPAHGYRIARLGKDLHEFLKAKKLKNVTLAGHSMGCSVIWSCWDSFGRGEIDRLILVDQAPVVTAWPGWSEEETAEAGSLFTPQPLYDTAAGLSGPDGIAVTEALVAGLFSGAYPAEDLAWVIQQNLKLPRAEAARLLVDHGSQDWRDVIPSIDVPTLVVGGQASIFNPISQAWIADQIPGAELSIFEAWEGGSHFMFLENPEKFNALVLDFLG